MLCDSLVEADKIYIDEINELLLDCNPNELKIIIDIMKSVKITLRRYNKLIKNKHLLKSVFFNLILLYNNNRGVENETILRDV
ncbi:MAG: hypothetical protein V8R64_10995 [Thomasclavelia sp.]